MLDGGTTASRLGVSSLDLVEGGSEAVDDFRCLENDVIWVEAPRSSAKMRHFDICLLVIFENLVIADVKQLGHKYSFLDHTVLFVLLLHKFSGSAERHQCVRGPVGTGDKGL